MVNPNKVYVFVIILMTQCATPSFSQDKPSLYVLEMLFPYNRWS